MMMLQELSLRLSAMLPVTFWWHVLCWPASAAVEALCWMLRRPHAALQKVKKQQVPWNGARDAPQSSCFLSIIPWGTSLLDVLALRHKLLENCLRL